ncbi:GNAT family N-acetyltransferase [Roseateles koreensis]|uniref:GNAT family N-acetyltransferase n=1 Tax=Roseateles koreensis TaxID=2987526 RepID=A0ABT5KVV8_9BURK|nr:GNAT family N-acetyltransferase [Roseateles koreensis]MDC8787076.1 GNAT family N-acetyltransferase [Roseateles koreensis]
MRVQLRPADAVHDQALMRQIYASTREDELALTPWSAEQRRAFTDMQFNAQQAHYLLHYPQSICQVISVVEGDALRGGVQDVGRLWVDQRSNSVHVLDISVLSAARGQGIGTLCLEQLQREAHQRGHSVTIFVELHNPARRLYERLGFEAEGAPQGLYQFMACRQPVSHTVNEECLS